MSKPGPVTDKGFTLRCAALAYAETMIATGGAKTSPEAKRAWDRLRRAAERYRLDKEDRAVLSLASRDAGDIL